MIAVRTFVLSDDSGQGLVEYAIVIALVALVCIGSLLLFATRSNNSLSNSAQKIPG